MSSLLIFIMASVALLGAGAIGGTEQRPENAGHDLP